MVKSLALATILAATQVGPSCGGTAPARDDLVYIQLDDEDSYPRDIIEQEPDYDPPPEIWSEVDGNSPADESSRKPLERKDVKIDWEMPPIDLPGSK